jgi:hypothetical protein
VPAQQRVSQFLEFCMYISCCIYLRVSALSICCNITSPLTNIVTSIYQTARRNTRGPPAKPARRRVFQQDASLMDSKSLLCMQTYMPHSSVRQPMFWTYWLEHISFHFPERSMGQAASQEREESAGGAGATTSVPPEYT